MTIVKKRKLKQPKEPESYLNAIYNRREQLIYLKKKSTRKYIQKKFVPSFFIHTKDKDKFKLNLFDCKTKVKDEGNYQRIYYDPIIDRDELISIFKTHEELGIPILEGDVDPVRRYLIDTEIPISTQFKTLFIDIETHPLSSGFSPEAKRNHRIISFAAIDYQTSKKYYYGVKKSNDREEGILLDKLISLIKQYDVVLAWNGDNYDFFVIRARMQRHKRRFDWRTVHFLDHMMVVKKLLFSGTEFKRSFALDSIGENILGIRKIDTGVSGAELYTLLEKDPELLKKYNIHDVVIMEELEKKRGFIDLWYSICSITRTFPNHRSIYPSYRTDGMLLQLASKEGIRFPTFYRNDEKQQFQKYEGAYVMEPIVGFHTDVQVPDFASLYPSIMISWNMSYETIINENDRYDGSYCRATASGCNFRTDKQGIIPKALITLIEERKKYKKKTKEFEVGSFEYKNMDNLSTAVKVVANSIYGLMGNEGNRYYNRDIARSVTLTGQFLSKYLKGYFDNKGKRTVYGDTDSTFVQCSSEEIKRYIIDLNNNVYPKLLHSFGCPTCEIKLDYDKGFESLLMIKKKNYAGKLSIHKGRKATENTPLEIKGLEIVRSDKIRYVQKIQKEFLNLILESNCDPEMINDLVIEEGRKFFDSNDITPEEIVISKSISKPLDEYKGKVLAVDVARMMEANGQEVFVGMKIPYIVTQSNPVQRGVHVSKYNGNFDRKYYWKNLIFPPLDRIIRARFPDFHFDDMNEPRQLKLDFGCNDPSEKTKSIKKVEGKMIKKR
jgi:DNA polymerase elongation subunit (family B)